MKAERILQSQGFGSRRECRAIIRAGMFSVDGEIIEDPFAELGSEGLDFEVDGVSWRYREKAYLMLHKPGDYECSHKPQHHPSIFALLPPELVRRDVQCIGRLDHDTTGLLLLSDDGQFIHYWSSGKKRIPKTYEIVVRHPVSDEMVGMLLEGVQLHDEPAPIRAVGCERKGELALSMTVTEGKYHQVKRMISAASNRVEALHRSKVGGLALPTDLEPGQWRWLSENDLERLSSFLPV
jgi:16S rRNA pseudouridine516 synthase